VRERKKKKKKETSPGYVIPSFSFVLPSSPLLVGRGVATQTPFSNNNNNNNNNTNKGNSRTQSQKKSATFNIK
jgi:hypothetical protein